MDRFTHAVLRAYAVALLPLSFALLSDAASAAEPEATIGHVKTVVGEAWVGVRESIVAAQVGTPVLVGSTLKTGPEGSLGVTLNDETVISIGPDSEVSVEEFAFNPEAGDLKLGASMVRGTLNFISGLIAKMRPEAQTVRTPTGMIGVRGTHFLVKVTPPNP